MTSREATPADLAVECPLCGQKPRSQCIGKLGQPTPTHGCPGCGTQVRHSMLACKPCWWRLPAALREAVNGAWRQRRMARGTGAKAEATAVHAHRLAVADACEWYRARRTGGT